MLESSGQLPLMSVPSSLSRAGTGLTGCWAGWAKDITEVKWKEGEYPIISTNMCGISCNSQELSSAFILIIVINKGSYFFHIFKCAQEFT